MLRLARGIHAPPGSELGGRAAELLDEPRGAGVVAAREVHRRLVLAAVTEDRGELHLEGRGDVLEVVRRLGGEEPKLLRRPRGAAGRREVAVEARLVGSQDGFPCDLTRGLVVRVALIRGPGIVGHDELGLHVAHKPGQALHKLRRHLELTVDPAQELDPLEPE